MFRVLSGWLDGWWGGWARVWVCGKVKRFVDWKMLVIRRWNKQLMSWVACGWVAFRLKTFCQASWREFLRRGTTHPHAFRALSVKEQQPAHKRQLFCSISFDSLRTHFLDFWLFEILMSPSCKGISGTLVGRIPAIFHPHPSSWCRDMASILNKLTIEQITVTSCYWKGPFKGK